jgi:hypothetical protein
LQINLARADAPAKRAGAPLFLDLPGEMAARIRDFDWRWTPLGDPESWPQSLKTLVSVMLASAQPMFMAWGKEQTWLYNDAFIPILGAKHPHALGRPAIADVWSEARDALAPLFERVFAGEPVHMEDFALLLDRHGRLEEAHFAFSYTPARDEEGQIAGLFGACMETTAQVLANRREAAQREKQRRDFAQVPSYLAILRGRNHVFDFTTEAFKRLASQRPLHGISVRDAFPELRGQGFYELLDRVYTTGEPYVASGVAADGQNGAALPIEDHLFRFVYAPISDESGQVTGIFVYGREPVARE